MNIRPKAPNDDAFYSDAHHVKRIVDKMGSVKAGKEMGYSSAQLTTVVRNNRCRFAVNELARLILAEDTFESRIQTYDKRHAEDQRELAEMTKQLEAAQKKLDRFEANARRDNTVPVPQGGALKSLADLGEAMKGKTVEDIDRKNTNESLLKLALTAEILLANMETLRKSATELRSLVKE